MGRYEQAAARPPDALDAVPDVYTANSMLEQRVQRLEAQLGAAQKTADNASGSWDKFRKERDFHRLHHRRVLQEKNRLVTDIRRLKQHYSLVRCLQAQSITCLPAKLHIWHAAALRLCIGCWEQQAPLAASLLGTAGLAWAGH